MLDEEAVRRIKEKYASQLLEVRKVVGVGIGKEGKKSFIEILVEKKLREHEKLIPKSLEGVPTKIREVGPIKALRREGQLGKKRPRPRL